MPPIDQREESIFNEDDEDLCISFQSLIENNKWLLELELINLNLPTKMIEAIVKGLQQNSTLQTLSIIGNYIVLIIFNNNQFKTLYI